MRSIYSTASHSRCSRCSGTVVGSGTVLCRSQYRDRSKGTFSRRNCIAGSGRRVPGQRSGRCHEEDQGVVRPKAQEEEAARATWPPRCGLIQVRKNEPSEVLPGTVGIAGCHGLGFQRIRKGGDGTSGDLPGTRRIATLSDIAGKRAASKEANEMHRTTAGNMAVSAQVWFGAEREPEIPRGFRRPAVAHFGLAGRSA